ncbi:b12 binding domain protein [Bacteroides intestinalis CAG:315]|jgi:corrinoid protein of di/trimethylamine methyltransferase|uniref:Cobalamin-binding protein n=1 Tax=Bacteroides intestinalis TaxID=329854 RepID=A0A412XT55_9BACE|nr:corrinoid protein [Bacteroides intestinalis]RGV48271.1 cobalamin-binding protein [Bacteroides intestinalis]RHA61069.1 cobalamin-binding protein [Bacteroides intestinalis]CDD90983.1 b12 binding domain protein [Bacteroides intestinalis CAG:315]
MADLKLLFEAILKGKQKDAVEITQQAINENIAPKELIDNYLIKAMEEIGSRFEQQKAFVPELLMAGRAMKSSLILLQPLLKGGDEKSGLGTVVIGTVKGDLHDIGKNLVGSMFEGCGFQVIDLGVDADSDKFISAVKEHQPDVIGLSALLTTTMPYMKTIIDALEEAGLRQQVKVMVGGAPVSAGFAAEIGADGYSDSANSAVVRAKELLGITH